MKKEIIRRTVSLEPFKSRFPGLLPYVDYSVEGMTTNPGDSTLGSNWGKIVKDISCDLPFPETYKYNGAKIYSFVDLEKRYHKMLSLIENGIVLKRIFFEGSNKWLVINDISFIEKLSLDFYDSNELFGRSFDNEENAKYVTINDEIIPDDKNIIFAINDFSYFEHFGGKSFIEFYDKMRGILRTPISIEGQNVPSVINYADIKHFLQWMKILKSNTGKIIDAKYNSFGGDKMLSFLEENEDILENTLTEIENMSFSFPNITLQINLNRSGEFLGEMDEYIDDTADFSPIKVDKERIVVSQGESRLKQFMEDWKYVYSETEDGPKKINGVLKNATYKDGDSIILYYGNDSVWREIEKDKDDFEKVYNYVTIPSYSNLSDKSLRKENVLIKYDNRFTFGIDDTIKDKYIKIYLDNTMEIIDGKQVYDIIEYYNSDMYPDVPRTDCVYHLVNGLSMSIYPIGSYIMYSDNMWVQYSLPSLEYYEVTEDDIVRIELNGENYIYGGEDLDHEHIFMGEKYYSVKEKDLSLPFQLLMPINVFKKEKLIDNKFMYVGDFVYSIENNDNSITFKYVLSSPFNYTDNGIVFPNLIEDYYSNDLPEEYRIRGHYGIFYEESYSVEMGIKERITIDKKSFNYIYDKIGFQYDQVNVKNPYWNLSRNVNLSNITTKAYGDIENKVVNPYFANPNNGKTTIRNKDEINVTYNRGNATAYESYFKLMECNSFEDLENYGNNYFKIQ